MILSWTLIGTSATFYNLSKYEFGRHKRIKEKIQSQISIYQKKRLTDPFKDSDLKSQWILLVSPLPFIIFPDINLADIKGSRRKLNLKSQVIKRKRWPTPLRIMTSISMTSIDTSSTLYNLSRYQSGRYKRIREKIQSQISIYQKKRFTDPSKDNDLKSQWPLLDPLLLSIVFPDINLADIKRSRRKFNLKSQWTYCYLRHPL